MTYRKLEVDGKQYEYVIGKTNTKVRGGKTYSNEDIGDRVNNTDTYIVTPYNVANAIKGIVTPREVRRCGHGTTTHKTTIDPFAAEIYNVRKRMIDCTQCVHEREMEI